MAPSTASAAEAARQFWAHELGKASADEVGPIVEAVHTRLREVLSRWIGAEGFRALFSRAAVLAQPGHPALGAFSLGGTDEAAPAVQTHGAAQVTAAMTAQLAEAIDLLGRIVGEGMSMQLVKQAGVGQAPRTLSRKTAGGRNG